MLKNVLISLELPARKKLPNFHFELIKKKTRVTHQFLIFFISNWFIFQMLFQKQLDILCGKMSNAILIKITDFRENPCLVFKTFTKIYENWVKSTNVLIGFYICNTFYVLIKSLLPWCLDFVSSAPKRFSSSMFLMKL